MTPPPIPPGTPPGRPTRPHDNGDGDGRGRGPCATAGSVAGLAREVETVRRAVNELAPLGERVEKVARLAVRLSEDVADLAAANGQAAEKRPQPCWVALPAGTSVEAAAELLGDLARWVGSVYRRYADGARSLPGCWLYHPDVVEELLWLRRAHHAAYAGPKAAPTAVGDWHDRYRPGVARRVNSAAGTCSIEQHQPGRTPLPDPDAATGGVPAVVAVEPIAVWWSTNPDAEPPPPTAAQLDAARAGDRPSRSRR